MDGSLSSRSGTASRAPPPAMPRLASRSALKTIYLGFQGWQIIFSIIPNSLEKVRQDASFLETPITFPYSMAGLSPIA